MAIGQAANFKVYNEQFSGGAYEGLDQVVEAFNGNSRNAIRLVSQAVKGDYAYESFFKEESGLVSRRDTTSVADVTPMGIDQDEIISVKINRKFGPVANTLDSLKKITKDQKEMSFVLGQWYGLHKAKDMINTSILAVEAAIGGQTNLVYDATGQSTKTMMHAHLVKGLALFGDMASSIVAWVMHSKPYFDLVGQAISDNVYEVGGATIYSGTVATLGRPTIVIDAPALHDANGSATDTYNTLGLVADSVVATESEDEDMVTELKTGKEQLYFQTQGEFAYNLECKGFKWDVTNGAANPTDTALGTGTNWDKAVTHDKQLSGVSIKTQ